MVVAGNALGRGDLLVFDRGLENHALGEFIDQTALDLLPRRLVCRIVVAAITLQFGPTGIVLLLRDQNVRGALVEVDAHAVSRLEDGKAATRRRLGRGIQDRRRARGAGLPAVADAGERAHALLYEVGGRPHVHHLGAAWIADGAGAAHEQQARLVDLQRGV